MQPTSTSSQVTGCTAFIGLTVGAFVFVWLWFSACSEPSKPPQKKAASAEDIRKQPERQAFIDSLVAQQFILRVEKTGSTPRVYVGTAFPGVPFHDKQTFLGVVLAYHETADPNVLGLAIHDGFTGREIGTLTRSWGLRLK